MSLADLNGFGNFGSRSRAACVEAELGCQCEHKQECAVVCLSSACKFVLQDDVGKWFSGRESRMFACCPQCEIFHASSRAVGQRASDIQGAQHAIGAAFVVLRTKRRWVARKCMHA